MVARPLMRTHGRATPRHPLHTRPSPCGRVQAALAAKLAEVDRRLEELHSFRGELATLIKQASELSKCGADAQVCAIVEEAPALPVTEVVKQPLVRRARRGAAG